MQADETLNNGSKRLKLCLTNNHTNNYNTKCGGGREEEDRLSSLPDTLLTEIITLLPIQLAAKTSVLSHRWRYLWTYITRLHLTLSHSLLRQNPEDFDIFNDSLGFITTGSHILRQIKSTKLHSFSVRIFGTPKDETDQLVLSSFLNSWLPQICARNPDQIHLFFVLPCGPHSLTLPPCIFQAKSLVELTFCGYTGSTLPDDAEFTVSLPNLRKLQIRLSNSGHSRLMGTLLKSCSFLEYLDLEVDFRRDAMADCSVDISAPNLKSLFVHYITIRSSISEDMKFVIDAPKLEYIKLKGPFVLYDFVKSPNSLLVADISLWRLNCAKYSDVNSLFRGISCARTLVLSDTSLKVFNSVDYADADILPVFCHLTHLEIKSVSQYHEMIWNCAVPGFLLTKLKTIEMPNVMCSPNEMLLLRHILSCARLLEQLSLSVLYRDRSTTDCEGIKKDQLWKEYKFWKELFSISRSYPECQIEFSGHFIRTSSKDALAGRLVD